MQPSNPLIAVSIGAVIAMSTVGTASAQAIYPVNPRQANSTKRGLFSEPYSENMEKSFQNISHQTRQIEVSQQIDNPKMLEDAIDLKEIIQDDKRPEIFTLEIAELTQAGQPQSTHQESQTKPARVGQAGADPSPPPLLTQTPQPETPLPQISTPDLSTPSETSTPTTDIAPESQSQEQVQQDIQQQLQQGLENPVQPGGINNPTQGAPGSTTSPGRSPSPPQTVNPNATPAVSGPAPDYLDPDPNPLQFPTRPQEVQIVGTQPITLQQAIELSVRNNPDLRQARSQLAGNRAQLRQSQAANFPTLNANTNYTNSGSESAGTNFTGGTNLTDGTNLTGGTDIQTNSSNTLGANLELSYNIFTSGQRAAQIDAARRQVTYQQLEIEKETEDLILDTTTNYYSLQQQGENVRIQRDTVLASEQSLKDAQALERAGVGTRFDVLQAQVTLANDRQQLTSALSSLEIARRQLAQTLNLAQSIDLAAADPVRVAGVWDLTLEDTLVQAFKNRAELEQYLVQRDIYQANRRAALAQLGPQVSLTGSFGVQNNLDEGNGFLYNYSVALGVSLNLFDGGSLRAQANQQEANIATAESQFESVRNQVRFNVEQAYSQLQSNFENIQTTALAVTQAREALRLARLRFQAGVGTQTDVLNQQSALTTAEVNNVNAILDYNRALATLQRQVSNLPEGYLSDVP